MKTSIILIALLLVSCGKEQLPHNPIPSVPTPNPTAKLCPIGTYPTSDGLACLTAPHYPSVPQN